MCLTYSHIHHTQLHLRVSTLSRIRLIRITATLLFQPTIALAQAWPAGPGFDDGGGYGAVDDDDDDEEDSNGGGYGVVGDDDDDEEDSDGEVDKDKGVTCCHQGSSKLLWDFAPQWPPF